MSNYANRRARGQCASCTEQAEIGSVRCEACQEKSRDYQRENSKTLNAKRRERYFQESMERERRLGEIDEQLKIEIAKLEKTK